MNEKIFNIGYEALTKAIQRIAIQSKYMMFEEKEKEQ